MRSPLCAYRLDWVVWDGVVSCRGGWFSPFVAGPGLAPRLGHVAGLVTPTVILVPGAWDPQEDDAPAIHYSDAFLLDTGAVV